jgi:rare lipoprotein A (peptidoglycan hydrolase)
MNETSSRRGRNQTSDRRRGRRVRLGLSLAAMALAGFGAIPAAQATTGGASGYEAAAPEGEELAFGPMRYGGASWYGPGLWGRSTACGAVLRPTTIGVAHKTLPCGTMVRFTYEGRTITAPVIDRGPYVKGRAWDLTAAASEALGFEAVGVGRVGYQLAVEYARP